MSNEDNPRKRSRGSYLSWLEPKSADAGNSNDDREKGVPRSTAWRIKKRHLMEQTKDPDSGGSIITGDTSESEDDNGEDPGIGQSFDDMPEHDGLCTEIVGSTEALLGSIERSMEDAHYSVCEDNTVDEFDCEEGNEETGDDSGAASEQSTGLGSEETCGNSGGASKSSGFRNLKDFLKEESNCAPITEKVVASKAEILLMALEVAKAGSFSNNDLLNVFKLVNSIFAKPVVPNTQYETDKLFFQDEFTYTFYCSQCHTSLGEKSNEKTKICPNCDFENNISNMCSAPYFVTVDISEQLKILLEEVGNELLDPRVVAGQNDGYYKDIYDGEMYQAFASSLPPTDKYKYVSLAFCVDGAPLFKSSKISMWPILIMILELPPSVRTKRILLAGLWIGPSKPPMDAFLETFTSYISTLGSEGLEVAIDGNNVIVKIVVACCCVDSMARGPAQGVSIHIGQYPCSWCLIPGERQEDNSRKFPILNTVPYPQRTRETMIQHASKFLECQEKGTKGPNGKPVTNVYGVRSGTPLMSLPKFDLVKGMIVDVMHSAWLGVAKHMSTKAWFENDTEAYYIGTPTKVSRINAKIQKLTCPIEARRLPRSADDMAFWKSREWEEWTLLYSIPVLSGILPDRYLKHWALFVQAMHLLCSTCVSSEDILLANELLIKFAEGVETLYGLNHMTFNMHIILHLPENVRRWGPLPCICAYAFEAVNGDLKKVVHANRGIEKQICRSLCHRTAAKLISGSLTFSTRVKLFLADLHGEARTKNSISVGGTRVFGLPQPLLNPSDEVQYLCSEVAGANTDHCVTYKKAFVASCIIDTSTISRVPRRTNNAVVELNDGRLVLVKNIVVDESQSRSFLLCALLQTEPLISCLGVRQVPLESVRKVRHIADELVCVLVSDVKSVAFYSKLQDMDVVATMPNVFATS